jgi:hypothetical protein
MQIHKFRTIRDVYTVKLFGTTHCITSRGKLINNKLSYSKCNTKIRILLSEQKR